MSKIKEGFKVVRPGPKNGLAKDNGKYLSAIASLVYNKPGEWTKPKRGFGPLAVFESEETAKQFMDNMGLGWAHLFRCEYRESMHTSLWEYVGETKAVAEATKLPRGTKFASSVRLMERVN